LNSLLRTGYSLPDLVASAEHSRPRPILGSSVPTRFPPAYTSYSTFCCGCLNSDLDALRNSFRDSEPSGTRTRLVPSTSASSPRHLFGTATTETPAAAPSTLQHILSPTLISLPYSTQHIAISIVSSSSPHVRIDSKLSQVGGHQLPHLVWRHGGIPQGVRSLASR
jgi:hypothetical protein